MDLTRPIATLPSTCSSLATAYSALRDARLALAELEREMEWELEDTELDAVCARYDALTEEHSALRATIDELSRPFLRRLSILDLPDEILLLIFDLVECFDLAWVENQDPQSSSSHYFGPGREDIKAARLVCRRFCAVASKMLVRLVRVTPSNPDSVERLAAISRHPAISTGVCTVRVVLYMHDPTPADRDVFYRYHAAGLESHLRFVLEASHFLERSGIPQASSPEILAEALEALSPLRYAVSQGFDFDDAAGVEADKECWERLDEIYREYVSVIDTQKSLLNSETFPKLVGDSMSRMPRARRLELHDFDRVTFLESDPALLELGVWDLLRHLMLSPFAGHQARMLGFNLPDYQLVPQLMDAVEGAGVLLDAVEVDLSTVGLPGSLVPAPQQLSSGMPHPRRFSFTCDGKTGVQATADVEQFLSACLDTPSLQKLTLDLKDDETSTPRIDLAKAMGSRARPELVSIRMRHVMVDLADLVRLLDVLPEEMVSLEMEDVLLHSGTWKEALDALRRKSCQIKELRRPQGAELDDMSHREYVRIFSAREFDTGSSPADFYISDECFEAPNPLQALEDRGAEYL